jgi:hypothetical protein
MNDEVKTEMLRAAIDGEMQASTSAMLVNRTLFDANGVLQVRIRDVIMKALMPWAAAVDEHRKLGQKLRNDAGDRRRDNHIDGKLAEVAVYLALQHTSLASYWPVEIDLDIFENNTFRFDVDLKPRVHVKACLDSDRFGPSWMADRNDPLVDPRQDLGDPGEIIVLVRVLHRHRPEILGWVSAKELKDQGKWVPSFYIGHKKAIYLNPLTNEERGISTNGIRDILQPVTIKEVI